MGANVQDRGRDSHHYNPWLRSWYVTVVFTDCWMEMSAHIVLGYYVTVLTIEKLGRKWIQIQGFLAAALFRTCHLFVSLLIGH
jgi:PHS family inorganic phosphate transporter-like MFS transporter